MTNNIGAGYAAKMVGLISFIVISFFSAPSAFAISEVTGSNATSSIDVAKVLSDITIVGDAASTTPVKLVVTSGSLSMSETAGLTFDGATTGATLKFSGTVADLNAALATLSYTRGAVGTDTLEISLVDGEAVFFPENGHVYEYIPGDINAVAARAEALTLTRFGAAGYLTTITSANENAFAAARLSNAGWMGASDETIEGDWKWIAGPESGTSFWSGNNAGVAVGGQYENWAGSEPNNQGDEDCAQFLAGGTGLWNDLQCVDTLPGYIAEFGAAGDLPTVISKNISLATIDSPVVDTYVPADEAVNVDPSANIVLTFDRVVTVATGTIIIYKKSDDSVVETLDITSDAITGSGSTVITIDPVSRLTDSTEYYLHIASTTLKAAGDVFYLGIESGTPWTFTTGDYTAPVLSAILAESTSDEITVTWTTDEMASTKVVYGVEETVDSSTSEINTAPRVTSHSVVLSELGNCTEYYLKVVSEDGHLNQSTSTVQITTTRGCPNGSSARVGKRIPSVSPMVTVPVVAKGVKELYEEGKIKEAALSILTDKDIVKNKPELVIQILNDYIEQLQSGEMVFIETSRPSSELVVRDLYLDMEGNDVYQLQELLISKNVGPAAVELARVSATGYFSNYTKNALGEYQKEFGIDPYMGYFGHITRTQMETAGLAGLWW